MELVASAGHDAQFASRRVFPIRFILRHYPVRSQAHGVRKIFEERKPRFLDEERQLGWHVQYDDISTGHRFIRDPETLVTFNPDRVRADSLIQDIDELQVTLDQHQQRSVDLQAQVDRQTTALAERDRTTAQLKVSIELLERDLTGLYASHSWKITAPLRAIWRLLQRL